MAIRISVPPVLTDGFHLRSMPMLSRLAFLLLGLPLSGPALATEEPMADFEQLLETYVQPDGVDYAAWHDNRADVERLKRVTGLIGRATLDGLSREERLSFHLNAYNAWMLALVLEDYPLDSVKDIGLIPFSVFSRKRVTVAGERMSLNHLEKEIIIREYGDPRIHFALNCASRSCPPLARFAFAGDKLEAQLEAVTRAYARSTAAARIDRAARRVELVEIFNWYGADFEAAGGAVAFLNAYRNEPIPADFKVGFYPYDWSLNTVSR